MQLINIDFRFMEVSSVYDDLLGSHPITSSAWKRKVAVLKAQGKTVEAIKELNEVLKV